MHPWSNHPTPKDWASDPESGLPALMRTTPAEQMDIKDMDVIDDVKLMPGLAARAGGVQLQKHEDLWPAHFADTPGQTGVTMKAGSPAWVLKRLIEVDLNCDAEASRKRHTGNPPPPEGIFRKMTEAHEWQPGVDSHAASENLAAVHVCKSLRVT